MFIACVFMSVGFNDKWLYITLFDIIHTISLILTNV